MGKDGEFVTLCTPVVMNQKPMYLADRVRPRLRLHGAGRHRAGPEAFPKGVGAGGTRGDARSGQEWAAGDCGPGAQSQGAEDGCGFLSAGRHAAVSREVAARDLGDHLRDRHAEQVGLDINDPRRAHVLRALPGRTFSALQLICSLLQLKSAPRH